MAFCHTCNGHLYVCLKCGATGCDKEGCQNQAFKSYQCLICGTASSTNKKKLK